MGDFSFKKPYYGVPIEANSIFSKGTNTKKQETPCKDNNPNEQTEELAQGSPIFDVRTARYKFDDLILPDCIISDLEILQSMISNYSVVYEQWGLNDIDPYGKQIAFNLYGPPGTGKTMIVEAICHKWNKPLIDINLAQLESKYVGDTGKNIVKAFKKAQETGALLFFDEADTVLGRRLAEVTQSADSSVNTARGVMLKQLEQHTGIVAFASNFPKNYDNAFVRRILMHIHIPLPDCNLRLKLWKKKIPLKVPGRNQLDYEELARISEGFSGADILNAVKNALFDAARMQFPLLTTQQIINAMEHVRSAKKNIGRTPKIEIKELTKQEAERELSGK